MRFLCLQTEPRAVITLTEKDIEVLTLCGSEHYDYKCQAAVKPGGFVSGWKGLIQGTEPGGEVERIITTFRELDRASKMLEVAASLFGVGTPDRQVAAELSEQLKTAMKAINQFYLHQY